MSDTRFLITGATGATGGAAAAQLLDKGERVRAFVHRKDARSEALRKRGAEVVVGDLLDFDAVREALNGVNRAYFVYPIRPGLVQATAQFAQSALEAGVEGIVNMSQISARGDAKEPFGPRALAGGTGFRLVRAQRCSRPADLFRGMAALPSPDDPPGCHVRTIHDRPARTHRR